MTEQAQALRRVRSASRRRQDAETAWLAAIHEARGVGLSLAAIADEAGVTRGRIHQLTNRLSVEQDDHSGLWYKLDDAGERLHGPFQERPRV